MSLLPICLPFYGTTSIAKWYYNTVSHPPATSPHHPEYTTATNDYNTQLTVSELKGPPPALSSVLKYIPKAWPMGWVFYSERCPSFKRPMVVIVHYITDTSQRDPTLWEISLSDPSPLLRSWRLQPPVEDLTLGPRSTSFHRADIFHKGTFLAQLCMAFTYKQACVIAKECLN